MSTSPNLALITPPVFASTAVPNPLVSDWPHLHYQPRESVLHHGHTIPILFHIYICLNAGIFKLNNPLAFLIQYRQILHPHPTQQLLNKFHPYRLKTNDFFTITAICCIRNDFQLIV